MEHGTKETGKKEKTIKHEKTIEIEVPQKLVNFQKKIKDQHL
jgi:hypothetical protein